MRDQVTSGAGYNRNRTPEPLGRTGSVPLGFDVLMTRPRGIGKRGPSIEGDPSDHRPLSGTRAKVGVECAVRPAPGAFGGESVRNPRQNRLNNRGDLSNLLKAGMKGEVCISGGRGV